MKMVNTGNIDGKSLKDKINPEFLTIKIKKSSKYLKFFKIFKVNWGVKEFTRYSLHSVDKIQGLLLDFVYFAKLLKSLVRALSVTLKSV